MAQKATVYSGQGFSLRGEKDRFVLPAKLRNPLAEASGERTLCVSKHDRWPCLTGFGKDRVDTFEDLLDELEDKAIARGDMAFDRELKSAALYTFTPTNFDASGRFNLSSTLFELGDIGDALYFHGIGQIITIWNPEVLLAQGPEFAQMQAYCRQEMAAANAKGKGK
ncbi:division/cell wall cluster transcriptional repressor MraZ [Alteraurantiacibacter aquimixticola]|uniref:Division/cell wall cluster transcriptional repressor MraZ n=1 Tax=Alteraurantiacibacter aquimixticola TaxID=2489173 RepID=A0A4V6UGC0_9SPHN|nr:division/cell wall cluster transcriptional repressor MraZ [Alteraurantiacibacter aquimixticola]TIX51367.1 division/cell wall cluster transcriptional repressor MraZ [Alteraurantiacibacter aquimixticola]